jgi:hypothetical protein
MMLLLAPLAAVAEMIRLAVAPVFLLTGIAAFLAVMTGRLARIVDRARVLGDISRHPGGLDAGQLTEVQLLRRRIDLVKRAVLLSVAAALAVCLVIALLFVSSLVHLPIGFLVASIFIASMLLMMAGLRSLLMELRLALQVCYVNAEMLVDFNSKPRK